jgi:CHAD domain-containing protein
MYMSFKFLLEDKTVEDGFKRIALSQIDAALDESRDDQLDGEGKVHAVRTRCKKLRGLFRLVRPVFKDYTDCNTIVRKAAGSLSHVRDAHVLVQTYDDLVQTDSSSDKLRIRLVAEVGDGASEQSLNEALSGFADTMGAMRQSVTHWKIQKSGFDALAGGLSNNYGNARNELIRAVEKPTDEHFHETRKSAKYMMYHLNLLAKSAPEILKPQKELASRIGDSLGNHHNLALLKPFLSRQPKTSRRAFVLTLLERRQEELAGDAVRLGRQLLAEKPDAMEKRMRHYWRNWKNRG